MRYALQYAGGLLVTLIALELALWLLPVSHGFGSPALSRANPLLRYHPDTSYTSSSGWLMRDAVSGRINSLGFSGPEVQLAQRSAILIGDSFVDALMIQPGLRAGDLLARRGTPLPVATMGIAGADLPDYIVTAEWAARRFPVSAAVIVISQYDLTESIGPKERGYWYATNGGEVVVRSSSNVALRNLIGQSRLGSYLLYNLKFGPSIVLEAFRGEAKAAPAERKAFTENRIAEKFVTDAKRLQDRGIDVLLVFQGDHHAIYAGVPDSRSEAHLLMNLARSKGIGTLDLNPVFREAYRKTGKRFDRGGSDPHWNADGHRIAALAIHRVLTKLCRNKCAVR